MAPTIDGVIRIVLSCLVFFSTALLAETDLKHLKNPASDQNSLPGKQEEAGKTTHPKIEQSCGLSGSLEKRIESCRQMLGAAKATKSITVKEDNSDKTFNWTLIGRNTNGLEVWSYKNPNGEHEIWSNVSTDAIQITRSPPDSCSLWNDVFHFEDLQKGFELEPPTDKSYRDAFKLGLSDLFPEIKDKKIWASPVVRSGGTDTEWYFDGKSSELGMLSLSRAIKSKDIHAQCVGTL